MYVRKKSWTDWKLELKKVFMRFLNACGMQTVGRIWKQFLRNDAKNLKVYGGVTCFKMYGLGAEIFDGETRDFFHRDQNMVIWIFKVRFFEKLEIILGK